MARVPQSITAPPLTDAAYQRGKRGASPIDVLAVYYCADDDAVELTLRNDVALSIPVREIRELAKAEPAQLAQLEVVPGGDAISLRALDVDIFAPGLIADVLGVAFAKALGRASKGRTSPRKAAAARANGRKGGRPPKKNKKTTRRKSAPEQRKSRKAPEIS